MSIGSNVVVKLPEGQDFHNRKNVANDRWDGFRNAENVANPFGQDTPGNCVRSVSKSLTPSCGRQLCNIRALTRSILHKLTACLNVFITIFRVFKS
jgi:hypothetical protein